MLRNPHTVYCALFRYLLHEDHATFDFVKMLADLGGYLGLMLGYSAYSVADFIDYVWRKMNQRQIQRENEIREGKRRKKNTEISLEEKA